MQRNNYFYYSLFLLLVHLKFPSEDWQLEVTEENYKMCLSACSYTKETSCVGSVL